MIRTDPPVQRLLERAMVARIATVSRSGRPHVNPNYFVVDGSRIWLGTATGTLAARNVAANQSVQLLFEIEQDPADSGLVRITGTAAIRTEPDLLKEYKRRVARKYFRSLRGMLMSLRHLHRLPLTSKYLSTTDPTNRHCVIEVEPVQIEPGQRQRAPFQRVTSDSAARDCSNRISPEGREACTYAASVAGGLSRSGHAGPGSPADGLRGWLRLSVARCLGRDVAYPADPVPCRG